MLYNRFYTTYEHYTESLRVVFHGETTTVVRICRLNLTSEFLAAVTFNSH